MPEIRMDPETALWRAARTLKDLLQSLSGEEMHCDRAEIATSRSCAIDFDPDYDPYYDDEYTNFFRVYRVTSRPGLLWGHWRTRDAVVLIQPDVPFKAFVFEDWLARPVAECLGESSRDMMGSDDVVVVIKDSKLFVGD